MTSWEDIKDKPFATKILDHGYLVLRDVMGDDSSIVEAARVSYGQGTKTVNEDRGLIRYLLSHKHTTPFEMVEFKFICKMPIFVARQWIRHRTASVNEYSGRYSIMTNEFYLPELEVIMPQSKTNHQGGAGTMSDKNRTGVQWLMEAASATNYEIYEALLGDDKTKQYPYDPYHGTGEPGSELLDAEYEGVSRELARTVLPVSYYTELYWKIDLHNLLHFLKLRTDSHAQYEIRVYADAMYEMVKAHAPMACEAFEDYVKQAVSLSRMDQELLKDLLLSGKSGPDAYADLVLEYTDDKGIAKKYGMSMRELVQFKTQWKL